jgi:hypothetical protein
MLKSLFAVLLSVFAHHLVLLNFSQWGGLQLDKDIRTLMNYFASICQRTARDKFSRLVQICSVLQLEKVLKS